MVLVHIDRMLDGVAIGGPLEKWNGVGVAYDRAVEIGDDMRQTALQHRLAPPFDVLRRNGSG